MGVSITDDGLEEGSRSIEEVAQAVSAKLKPVMVEAVQSSCDKITAHARKVGVKTEQLLGEGKTTYKKLEAKMVSLEDGLSVVREEVISMSAKLGELQLSLAEVLTLARQGSPDSSAGTQLQAPQPQPADLGCYFCDEAGHVLMNCPVRVGCMACGSDMHRYEKCVHRTATCSRCMGVGHVSKVHQTTARELIKRLLAAHPHQFDHLIPSGPDEKPSGSGRPKGQKFGRGGRYGRN